MKTYTTTVEKPQLIIQYDDSPESPRQWDNLGYFITVDRQYHSPDRYPTLKTIIEEASEESENVEEHMKLITRRIKNDLGEKVLAIYPVVKYEHGNVSYRRGTQHGFDYSNNGFYIVTDRTAKIIGTPKKNFEKVIDQELDTYTKWANGEVYSYTLYNADSEVEDSCSGFYDIDNIKENLPDEWKDEDLSEYIKTS